MIHEAVEFAANAHKGMVRKGANNTPYIFHPLEVLHLVSLMTTDEDVLCAAVLHDVVEDTGVDISEIEEKFNSHVAKLVGYETEDKRGNVNKSETWMDRKKEAIDTIAERWGGHIVRNGFRISVLQSIGVDNGITIEYGKNLKSLTADYDFSNVCTKILPVGKDGQL